jgi:hypothetical protein
MKKNLLVLIILAAIATPVVAFDDALFNSLEYRLVGPYRGGRVTAVSGVPGDPMTYYMGSTGGGVWKTTDAGKTWRNVSDAVRQLEPTERPEIMGEVDPALAEMGLVRQPVGGLPTSGVEWRERGGDAFGAASIGAIAVAPSDTNVIYVGTGSACPRGNVSPGDGIYKSTDAGDTWRHIGLPEAGQIGRIVVHPHDPDIVYAAVLGHIFGPNPERGVYRSTNGGLTWSKVLVVSDRAGAVDLCSLCGHVGGRAQAVDDDLGRSGERALQNDRWRQHLARADRGSARGRQGPDRSGGFARRTEQSLGARRARRGRALPLG